MSSKEKHYEIKDLLKTSAEKLRTEFKEIQKATSHAAVKGYLWEESFRVFLRTHLPDSLDISRGFIIDSHGNQSKEIDIIISDKQKTPIFYKGGDARIIPVETVYAVIEVKSHLNNSELDKIFEHLKSIKKLKKDAYVETFSNQGVLNARELSNLFSNLKIKENISDEECNVEIKIKNQMPIYGNLNKIWPIHYFVFSFDSIKLSTLMRNINRKNSKIPFNERIDLFCVLEKGMIVNENENGLMPFSKHGTKLTIVDNIDFSFMIFFGLMSNVLLAAKTPGNIKYTDYMPQN